jgi:hypothetical protein
MEGRKEGRKERRKKKSLNNVVFIYWCFQTDEHVLFSLMRSSYTVSRI